MKLELKDVNKAWGGVCVLQNIDMVVDGTGITGLIGPNGAGKSTLFGVISGIIPTDSGSITFCGQTLDRLGAVHRARSGLSRTFQVPRPFKNLSVHANLCVAAPDQAGESLRAVFLQPRRVRLREQEIAADAERIARSLNLGHVMGLPASQLSGGQLKLLELGRLLMTKPKLILLDEPFAGVNPVLMEEISETIRRLAQRGTGFFVVEHNLGALSRLASHIFAMDQGLLIASGSPDEVLSNERVRTAYVGGVV